MKAIKLIFVLCILMVGLSGCGRIESTTLEAEVLTVNSEISEGKLIGQLFGSSSGWFKNDVIKVGVKFEIDDEIFLEDLKLSHAQLAYYKDKDTLPLKIIVKYNCIEGSKILKKLSNAEIEIRLCGYHVKTTSLESKLADKITIYLRNRN